MAPVSTYVLLIFIVVSSAFACTTEHKHITLHVYDCDYVDGQPLGDFIVTQTKTKQRRFIEDRHTCSKMPIYFLSVNPDKPNFASDVNPHLVAGAFVYKFFTARDTVFWGPNDVKDAVKNGRTYNLILDSEENYFVLQVKDKHGENEIREMFVSSADIMNQSRLSDEYEIVSCENFFVYLARESASTKWSITLTNPKNSNAEHRFKVISGGIAGFYARP